ncbi:MAG: alcohol dehydrogenase catalytic domain-containing protein [Armatimonadota bacterium]
MSSNLDTFRAGTGSLPSQQQIWFLYGEGLDNLGKDGSFEAASMPEYGADDVLARIDACGLCFSDIKVIRQGGGHPRLYGRDLANDPIVLGHEVALTIVGVGDNMVSQFTVGQRFIMQADIYYKGVNLAFGYMLPGGLEQYAKLSDEVLRGDDGCYLIPVHEDTGYAEAALAEPWACVVRAYRDTRRNSLKQGGKAWIVGTPEGANLMYSTAGMDSMTFPSEVVLTNCPQSFAETLTNLTQVGGIKLSQADGEDLDAVAAQHAPDGFDEIFVLGGNAALVEKLATFLGKDSFMTIVSDAPMGQLVSIDVGKVHYDAHQYVAAPPAKPLAGYKHPRPLKLKQGGTCWICGAGGPMGQMHVQLATEASDGPSVIVCTDIDTERLSRIPIRFGEAAEKRGAKLVLLNPKELGDQFEVELAKYAPGGYDDVVCLVPVPPIISQCSRFVGKNGVFNIFAGVGRGTMSNMDLDLVIKNNARFFGSSGSSIDDLKMTLSLAERGELSPNMAVAAIGGIEAVKEGLTGVQDSAFPGKVVIYPHIKNLPLTRLTELIEKLPEIAAKLGPDDTWTREAEVALLEKFLD